MAQTSPAARPDIAVWLAANNGDIGGGEVMLLRTAEAIRALDVPVGVVAPTGPAGVLDAARDGGFPVAALEASGRLEWMRELRRWDRSRTGVLWCHGLVPAAATAGHRRRVVHLHQHPQSALQAVMAHLARKGAIETLVPSEWMLSKVPGAAVLANWTDSVEPLPSRPRRDTVVVGFLGRLSTAKGVDVLAKAVAELNLRSDGRHRSDGPHRSSGRYRSNGDKPYRALIAGAPRFVSEKEQQSVERSLAAIEGWVDRPGWMDRNAFFAEVDIVVVPSVWSEPFGLSAAEAMAAGRPLVVSQSGALPEVVGEPSELTVPPADPIALADTLEALAEGTVPDGVAQRRQRWSQQYSPEAGRVRVAALLERIGVMPTTGHTPD